MTEPIISILTNAGPIGVLCWILWTVFQRQADAAERFGTGVLEEMKADRQTLRDEFSAMRSEHKEALTALRSEVAGMRADIAGGEKCPVIPLQRLQGEMTTDDR